MSQPDREGFYWYRHSDQNQWSIMEVFRLYGVGFLRCRNRRDDGNCPENYTGEWSLITPPSEVVEAGDAIEYDLDDLTAALHEASIWRALMERLAELNELDPEVAKQKTKLLAMALRDASDLLLKCSGATEEQTVAMRRLAHEHARSHHREECQCDNCSWTEGPLHRKAGE